MASFASKRLTRARIPVSRALSARFASTDSPRAIPKIPSSAYTAVTHPEDADSIPESIRTELDRAARYILPVYARPPIVMAKGNGAHVWDSQGRKYIDFSGGIAVNALGHADEDFVKILTKQASLLSHSSNLYYNEWATKLAELLITLTQREGGLGWAAGALPPLGISSDDTQYAPAGGAKVFFANTGTEANEGAIKVARKVGKERWAGGREGRSWDDPACTKYRLVCFENGFHGRSMGSLSLTSNPKYQKPFAPMVPGVDVGKLNDYDSINLITEDTCGVFVEPIQGEGGINAATIEWLAALRKRCDEVGAVLVFDEIQCGLYRTGTLWAHSSLPTNCHPDIVTMAKPLANGYPIGAILMRDSVAESMTIGTHGTTFGGSPLACALGFHVLSRLSERGFVAKMQDVSSHMHARLSNLPKWFPGLVSKEGIRGRGMILGIPFREPQYPAELMKMARERGVLILTAGKDAVRLVPSLNILKEDVDVALDVIESCLGEMHQR